MNRREFSTGAIAAALALGSARGTRATAGSAQSGANPPAVNPDRFALVDPELLPSVKDAPPLAAMTDAILAASRKEMGRNVLPAPAPQPVEKHIPGLAGQPSVRVLIVDPDPARKGKPALLHTHGGGYILGSADFFAFVVQGYAQRCGCVVVSVDYRLAPETRFPGSLDDNYAALLWLYRHADELGVDPKRIAVGGESAGGGHAAALAIRARDRKEVPIVLQLLVYPMLDDRTGSSRPVSPHVGQIAWGAEGNRFGWTALLGDPAGSAEVPYGSVPSRVERLEGLAPAFIGVGSIDLFVEEDIEYGRRLINAGISTELHVVPGAYHAFDLTVPQAKVSKQFRDSIDTALRRAFGTA
jgi:acetyl esterase/lipase